MQKKQRSKKVFYVHGGVDTDEREYIRQITEKSDNAIIIASYGTFSTGINIRNLHNIVFSYLVSHALETYSLSVGDLD